MKAIYLEEKTIRAITQVLNEQSDTKRDYTAIDLALEWERGVERQTDARKGFDGEWESYNAEF